MNINKNLVIGSLVVLGTVALFYYYYYYDPQAPIIGQYNYGGGKLVIWIASPATGVNGSFLKDGEAIYFEARRGGLNPLSKRLLDPLTPKYAINARFTDVNHQAFASILGGADADSIWMDDKIESLTQERDPLLRRNDYLLAVEAVKALSILQFPRSLEPERDALLLLGSGIERDLMENSSNSPSTGPTSVLSNTVPSENFRLYRFEDGGFEVAVPADWVVKLADRFYERAPYERGTELIFLSPSRLAASERRLAEKPADDAIVVPELSVNYYESFADLLSEASYFSHPSDEIKITSVTSLDEYLGWLESRGFAYNKMEVNFAGGKAFQVAEAGFIGYDVIYAEYNGRVYAISTAEDDIDPILRQLILDSFAFTD